MTLFAILIAILIVISFGLWLAASIPGSRVPEWSARLGFFVCSIIWLVTRAGLG